MKKYIAKTNVSINVVLPNGKNRHIAFSSLTGGGSVYYTDDACVIEAIESHYKYGTLFRADSSFDTGKQKNPSMPGSGQDKAVKADQPTDAESEESYVPDAEEVAEESEGKTVVVTDPDTAKAYLAEHFGVSRTKLKSIKAIKEAAEANGIVFEGI